MAIQFFCPACSQPIEVDDDAANQSVTCPYCQKIVTAPAGSDPAVRRVPPSARPSEAVAPPPPQDRPVRLGYGGLSCALVVLVIWAAFALYALTIAKDIPPNANREEITKLLQERFKGPGIQLASIFGSCLLPLAGVGISIASLVKKERPRWPAICALIALGLLGLLICLGVVLQAAATAANNAH